jgi:hypothetical protein
MSEKRPNRLEPPKKIELRSANTNPNPAPSGPPPVSQVRPGKTEGEREVRTRLHSTLFYYVTNMPTVLRKRCPVETVVDGRVRLYVDKGSGSILTPEQAVENIIDFYHELFLTIPNLDEMIRQRDENEKTLAEQIENVEQIRDEEGAS